MPDTAAKGDEALILKYKASLISSLNYIIRPDKMYFAYTGYGMDYVEDLDRVDYISIADNKFIVRVEIENIDLFAAAVISNVNIKYKVKLGQAIKNGLFKLAIAADELVSWTMWQQLCSKGDEISNQANLSLADYQACQAIDAKVLQACIDHASGKRGPIRDAKLWCYRDIAELDRLWQGLLEQAALCTNYLFAMTQVAFGQESSQELSASDKEFTAYNERLDQLWQQVQELFLQPQPSSNRNLLERNAALINNLGLIGNNLAVFYKNKYSQALAERKIKVTLCLAMEAFCAKQAIDPAMLTALASYSAGQLLDVDPWCKRFAACYAKELGKLNRLVYSFASPDLQSIIAKCLELLKKQTAMVVKAANHELSKESRERIRMIRFIGDDILYRMIEDVIIIYIFAPEHAESFKRLCDDTRAANTLTRYKAVFDKRHGYASLIANKPQDYSDNIHDLPMEYADYPFMEDETLSDKAKYRYIAIISLYKYLLLKSSSLDRYHPDNGCTDKDKSAESANLVYIIRGLQIIKEAIASKEYAKADELLNDFITAAMPSYKQEYDLLAKYYNKMRKEQFKAHFRTTTILLKEDQFPDIDVDRHRLVSLLFVKLYSIIYDYIQALGSNIHSAEIAVAHKRAEEIRIRCLKTEADCQKILAEKDAKNAILEQQFRDFVAQAHRWQQQVESANESKAREIICKQERKARDTMKFDFFSDRKKQGASLDSFILEEDERLYCDFYIT